MFDLTIQFCHQHHEKCHQHLDDTYFILIHFRAIGAAAITALRSANYQSTLEEALQVYEIEIVILVLKRCRTLAICHVFFAFW